MSLLVIDTAILSRLLAHVRIDPDMSLLRIVMAIPSRVLAHVAIYRDMSLLGSACLSPGGVGFLNGGFLSKLWAACFCVPTLAQTFSSSNCDGFCIMSKLRDCHRG
jgi:hypothetical protein